MSQEIILTRAHAEDWLKSGPLLLADVQARFGLSDQEWWRQIDQFSLYYEARERFVDEVSFGVPCLEAIAAIADAGALVEAGAGTGFWAALLAKRGCEVIACDLPSGQHYGQEVGRYHPVLPVAAQELVRAHREHNLLMVWPSYAEEWATETAANLAPGKLLFLVSEQRGGAIASDSLFRLLADSFEELDFIEIPRWPWLHDVLSVHRKHG